VACEHLALGNRLCAPNVRSAARHSSHIPGVPDLAFGKKRATSLESFKLKTKNSVPSRIARTRAFALADSRSEKLARQSGPAHTAQKHQTLLCRACSSPPGCSVENTTDVSVYQVSSPRFEADVHLHEPDCAAAAFAAAFAPVGKEHHLRS